MRHFIRCFVHGFDDGRNERLGNIADAHADDVVIRMRLRIGGDFLCDGQKQIAFLKVCVVLVEFHAGFFPSFYTWTFFIFITVSYAFFSLLLSDAPTKPRNNGCALFGRDLNSGWNCTPARCR